MLALELVRRRKSHMLENITSFLRNALYVVPAILISLTFHEFGHAYAAYKMGDPTARNLGRMTLNRLHSAGFVWVRLGKTGSRKSA